MPDLAPIYAAARLAVAPLRFGAGLKGKVLEAWAAGIPCAMTPIAAEGLPLLGDLAATVADGPAALAQLILDLHADTVRCERLRRAGRALLRSQFSRRVEQAALSTAITPPRYAAAVHLLTAGSGTPETA